MRSLLPSDRHFANLAAVVIGQVYAQRGFRPLWEADAIAAGFHRALGEQLKRHALPELLAIDPRPSCTGARRRSGRCPGPCPHRGLPGHGADGSHRGVPYSRIWADWDAGDKPGSDERSVESIVGDLVTVTSTRPFEMEKAIEAMGPKNWIYRELHKAYPAAKEAILKYSGLPQIPNPEQIGPGKPGEIYPAAPAIAAHLIDRGYLTMAPAQAAALTMMTRRSPAPHRLPNRLRTGPDGVFGQASWRHLNANAADRFRSIVINLHRARLMPGKPGDRYLIANLPCAELYLFRRERFPGEVDADRPRQGLGRRAAHPDLPRPHAGGRLRPLLERPAEHREKGTASEDAGGLGVT